MGEKPLSRLNETQKCDSFAYPQESATCSSGSAVFSSIYCACSVRTTASISRGGFP